MSFLRFVFSFLYTRNWHSGEMELSRERVFFLVGVVIIFLIATILITFLQTPVTYVAS